MRERKKLSGFKQSRSTEVHTIYLENMTNCLMVHSSLKFCAHKTSTSMIVAKRNKVSKLDLTQIKEDFRLEIIVSIKQES